MVQYTNRRNYVGMAIESGDKRPRNIVSLEEGNLTITLKTDFNVPTETIKREGRQARAISLSISGTHISNNKCSECGKAMEFYIEMDQGNRIDLTSSYSIDYLCEDGHNFRMSLDEAIDEYGTKL